MRECPRCGAVEEDGATRCAADGEELKPALAGPATIDDRYRLERRLGAGGMGVVYAARHVALDKRFALKLLTPPVADEASFAERFRLEARALGALQHPGIVGVTDFGVDPRGAGTPFLVMELLAGDTLHERCRGGPPPLATALEVIAGIAAALDHAHAAGIVHRDLKAANVMLVRSREGGEEPRILDFGLARIGAGAEPPAAAALADGGPSALRGPADAEEAARLTRAGTLLGTVGYLAPELVAGGEATPASDRYAFGVLCYELLAGTRPFTGEPWEVLDHHLRLPPPPVSALRAELPRELDAPLRAALAKDPAARPPSAGTLAATLRAAVAGAEAASRGRRERRRRLALAAALTATVVGVSPWLWRLPPVERVRLAAFDRQLAGAPPVAPDTALVIVAIDEATLAAAGGEAPLAAQADAFGRRIEELFAGGARGVAVDLLLPAQWRSSRPLAEALLRHGDRVTLAAFSTADGRVVGPEVVSPLVAGGLGGERAGGLFGFVNLEADSDGVVRRGRRWFVDRSGARRPSFAAAALARADLGGSRARAATATTGARDAARDGEWFWLDRAVDLRSLPRVAWQDVPRAAAGGAFRDRLVLVGGDFAAAGEDAHLVSAGGTTLPGLLVHSVAASTLRGGERLREVGSRWRLLTVAVVMVGIAVFILLARRALPAALALAVLLAGALALSTLLLWRHGLVADAIGPAFSVALGALASYALRAALAPSLGGAAERQRARAAEAPT